MHRTEQAPGPGSGNAERAIQAATPFSLLKSVTFDSLLASVRTIDRIPRVWAVEALICPLSLRRCPTTAPEEFLPATVTATVTESSV